MMWILIIWMYSNAPSMVTQEFNSESACRSAFSEIRKVNDGELYLRGVCTPMGAPLPEITKLSTKP